MKNILSLFCLILFSNVLVAQKISVSNDSLSKLLCKTWKIDYSFGDRIKTEQKQIPKNQIYELAFNSDYTFQVIGAGKIVNGKWCYNEINKDVELELRGENNLRIFSINNVELIMTFKKDSKKKFSSLPENFTHFSPK